MRRFAYQASRKGNGLRNKSGSLYRMGQRESLTGLNLLSSVRHTYPK